MALSLPEPGRSMMFHLQPPGCGNGSGFSGIAEARFFNCRQRAVALHIVYLLVLAVVWRTVGFILGAGQLLVVSGHTVMFELRLHPCCQL